MAEKFERDDHVRTFQKDKRQWRSKGTSTVRSKVFAALLSRKRLHHGRNEEIQFLRTLKRRECKHFIAKPNQDSVPHENLLCHCDYERHLHSKYAQEHTFSMDKVNWSPQDHTHHTMTNAFGEIEFVGYGDKVAKYVRVDVDTSMDSMLTLLTEKWAIEKPNLLISVTGGAKNFSMRTRLKEVFRRGLMKAALTTGAWIITGGTNAGVMKHVGEAVRDYGLTSQGRVMTIGIAPWGCVQNKEALICECPDGDSKGKWPALYRIENTVKSKQSFLDPNHSHFILVDNGTQKQFTVEIPFRAKLEEAIGTQKTDTGANSVSVPVCLLVLEGGPGTLQTVHSALMSNTPTVVIKGSGKTADILAFAYQNAKEEEITATDQKGNETKKVHHVLDDHAIAEIEEMVRNQFGEKNLTQHVSWVKDCTGNLDLLSVFELDAKGSAKDVDLAVLKALLKANKNEVMDQLCLALAWNRIDVAKSEIFTDERNWPTGKLDDVMMTAIQLNRVDFVELFLDNGVSLKDFLTIKRLMYLYNGIPQNSLLWHLLNKVKDQNRKYFSPADVGRMIQMLLGDVYQPHYLTDKKLREIDSDSIFNPNRNLVNVHRAVSITQVNALAAENEDPIGFIGDGYDSQFATPAQELFIWTIFMNKKKMSKLFWREAKESVAAALFGHAVLITLGKQTKDAEVIGKLQRHADLYEELAIGVINACYSTDDKRTHELLVRNMDHWGSTSCCLMAYHFDVRRFLAQTACQSLLQMIWMGEMSPETSSLKVCICIPCFFLIPLIIKFKKENQKYLVEKSKTESAAKKKAKESEPAPLSRQATTFAFQSIPEPESEYEERKHTMNLFSKMYQFYTAPIVSFSISCIFYFMFLLLYSYILVVKLSKDFHYVEGILIAWVITIFTEEVRQLSMMYGYSFKVKLKHYIFEPWNLLDIFTIVLFIIGMLLRFLDSDESLSAARIVLSLNLLSFFMRVLHIFSVNSKLGPMLIMITNMIIDLIWFVIILLVFVIAYAIAAEAILYPNAELNWKLFYYLPRKAYWHIYGELFLEELEGTAHCTNNATLYNDYSELRCPSPKGKYVVPILMSVYILLTNVMLLNLLIAMFSYTFQKIRDKSYIHWCYQRFGLVHEYTQRPGLPPPFIIFSHFYLCIKACCKSSSSDINTDKFRRCFLNLHEVKQLIQWENVIADNYQAMSDKSEANSVPGRVKSSMERLEIVLSKVDELNENHGQIVSPIIPGTPGLANQGPGVVRLSSDVGKRLVSMEKQLAQTTQALEWIMQSLQEHNIAAKRARPIMPNLKEEGEKRLKMEKEKKEKQLVKNILEKKVETHYKSRTSPYVATNIFRFDVPDEKVPWEVAYPEYDPPSYTSPDVLKLPDYADEDISSLSPLARKNMIPFNQEDHKCNISRVSMCKTYEVTEGLPVNPMGRTGMRGRGSLGRWGPNTAGDPIITRWKSIGSGVCETNNGKPVLEFIAVQRLDNSLWAIPGAICSPEESPWHMLKINFKEDLDWKDNPEEKSKMLEKLRQLSTKGKVIHQGYADDPRNTDNAWIETIVYHFHDEDGDVLQHFDIVPSGRVNAVSWQRISSSLRLHGAHSYFLKLTAEKLGAAF